MPYSAAYTDFPWILFIIIIVHTIAREPERLISTLSCNHIMLQKLINTKPTYNRGPFVTQTWTARDNVITVPPIILGIGKHVCGARLMLLDKP